MTNKLKPIDQKLLAKYFLAFIFLGISNKIFSQNNIVCGARSLGMSQTSLTVQDQFAIFNNIGALAGIQKSMAVFTYHKQFNIEGLQSTAAALVMPFSEKLASGISFTRFGDNLFSEQSLGFGISHKIANTSLGLKMNWVQIFVEGLGNRNLLVLEFGGIAQLSKNLWFGGHIFNLNQAKMAQYRQERYPILMKAGVSYRPSEKLMLNIETQKDLDLPANVRVGAEYQLNQYLAFRTGISSQPQTSSYGVSLHLWAWQVDYALQTHPYLQAAHHLSLTYKIRNLKKKEVEE